MTLQRLRFRLLDHPGCQGRLKRPFPVWAAAAAITLAAFPLVVLGNPQAKQEAPNTKSGTAPLATVQHVKLLLDNGNPALEIETTGPVNPQISTSEDAMQVVIDFPNTNMSVADKVVPIRNPDLSQLRLNLLNTTPAMVHVEVDFRKPLGYTWKSAGNSLLVSFHEINPDDRTAAPTSIPSPVSAAADAPDFAKVVPAERLAPGASITADTETTVLRLKRTGDVYVCPQTTVSVVRSRNGPDFTLAMNEGGLETHMTLQNSADEVLTPDFRILLRGPGEFHYAIHADSRGNTCVRTLPGNTAPAIIYELVGDGTYSVHAQDQLVFHGGRLSAQAAASPDSKTTGYDVLAVECGCPPPARATLLASRKRDPPIAVEMPSPGAPPPVAGQSGLPGPGLAKNSGAQGSSPPSTEVQIPDLPESVREQPHLKVEASLSFTPKSASAAASDLPASSRQLPSPVDALPPSPPVVPIAAPERHKTVFGKIKTFFSGVFH